MYKAIIFDYGGVLTTGTGRKLKDPSKEIALELGADPDGFAEVVVEGWLKARVNDIPSDMLWQKAAEFLEVDKEEIREKLINVWAFQDEVLDFAKGLKSDYKLGLLSNNVEDWLESELDKYDMREVFDGIVTSYGARIAKPDERIFKIILEKLEVEPEDCVYIDDLETNIETAQKLGMKPILFTSIDQLKEELQNLDIL